MIHRSNFWIRSIVIGICVFQGVLLSSPSLKAQFGFTPSAYMNNGYGSEWGNYYSSAIVQVPQAGYPTAVNLPSAYIRPGWQLGAYLQSTYNGVLIQQVVSGGLAERSGLKSGDIVVSVGGAQVGYVNGRNIDLIQEIGRRADAFGVARLVVLEAFSKQLRNYDLNIAQQVATTNLVSGRVFVDGMGLTSSQGSLKVELQNSSKPYLQASGGNDYKQVTGPGPYTFTINFDPRFVAPDDRYRLVATLYNAYQQIVGYTSFDIPVPLTGPTQSYDLRLQATPNYTSTMVPAFGTYYPNQNSVTEVFQQILGRAPSVSEAQVWTQQLASGSISISEMRAQVLASPAFYDRAGNNPDLFIQQMIVAITRQPAPVQQVQSWRSRLDFFAGNRLMLTREFLRGYSL